MLGPEADNTNEGGGKAGPIHTASNMGIRSRQGPHDCNRADGTEKALKQEDTCN